MDPLYDATRRYIQLGYRKPPSPTLCDHLSLHARPETADIANLAQKGRLLHGDDDTILIVRKLITVASALDSHYGRPDPPSMTSSAFMCHSWRYRGSCTYTTPMPLVASVSHTQNAGTLLLMDRYESLHQMLGTTLSRVSGMKTLSPNNFLAYTLESLAQQPRITPQCWLRWAPVDHSSRKFSQPSLHGLLQPTGGRVRCCRRGIYS